MTISRRQRMVALATVAVATVGVSIPAIASPSASTHHAAPLTSLLPSVLPQGLSKLVKVGDTDPASKVYFDILLAGRNAAELPTVASSVSNPKSSDFRHFLTKSEARAKFDPAPATTKLVETVLRGLGVTVEKATPDGRLIEANATAGLLTTVLGVHFENVNSNDGVMRVATTEPILPAVLKPLVSDIIGLTETPVDPMSTAPVAVSTKPVPTYYTARPCAAYFGQKVAKSLPKYRGKHRDLTICGYTPKQIRAAYRIPQTHLTGAGAKIGIVDDYSAQTVVKDTQHWSKIHGIPTLAKSQFVDHSDPSARVAPEVDVDVPGVGTVPANSPQSWSQEETVDVEMVHAMAPKATIEFYGGDQGIGLQPLEVAFTTAIAGDTAQFISDSFGAYEKYLLLTKADEQLMLTELELGATEGIGAAFSSGDDADNIEMNDVKAADFPASVPYGTAVGGTTLVVGKHNKYEGETYWGTRNVPLNTAGTAWDFAKVSAGEGPATGQGSSAGGGGGGVSSIYKEPAFQKGVVPKSLTEQTYTSPDGENTNNVTTPGRVVPDVSLVGDSTTGPVIGQTMTNLSGKAVYSQYRIGGTSVSCPLFAGMIALAIQANHDKTLGFVDPTLYEVYAKSRHAFRNPSLGSQKERTVRADYTDTGNNKSPKIYHLRLLGQLSTLKALKGYDNSTGLGTPCGPTFVAAMDKPTVHAKTAKVCKLAVKHKKKHHK